MRTYQHIIDTKAIKVTLNRLPHHWVVRELTERDYGIDLMMEIFEKIGVDNLGHDTFDATGNICYLQIKGTNSKFEYNADNSLSYSLDKDSLLYTEKFPTAFILVRVCTLEGSEKIHFLWLQRYIMEILDFENPDWRISLTILTWNNCLWKIAHGYSLDLLLPLMKMTLFISYERIKANKDFGLDSE